MAPIVEQRCASCHSGAAAPKGVRLETPEQIAAQADAIERVAVLTRAMPLGNSTRHDGRRARAPRAMDRLPAAVEPAVARLRELEPTAVAVLVGGSYAKGTADELSDLDLTALVERDGGRYRTWFQERPAMHPLHVSAGVKTIDERLAKKSEPASWWLGLPQLEPAVYAWATDDARARLGDDPSLRRPAGPPELEDFFELSMKVRRAIQAGDSLGLRVYAMAAAELAPRLLLPLNEPVLVSSRREAAEAALAFAVAPEHYAEDLRLSLGLAQADDATLGTAAPRLARELLAFLREHKPDVDPLPDLVRGLTDGTLERQLAS